MNRSKAEIQRLSQKDRSKAFQRLYETNELPRIHALFFREFVKHQEKQKRRRKIVVVLGVLLLSVFLLWWLRFVTKI